MASRRKSRERVAWGIAAAAVLAAGAATFGYIRRAPVEAPQMRLSILPPAKASFDFTVPAGGGLTVSPDGRRVTFIAKGSDGKSLLYVRALDDVNARPLAGTENASWPFWSPDSRFIAFFADGKLQKVDVSGAPPLVICDAPDGRSGSWNREGVILFSPDSTTPIYRVSASGGAATPVTSLDGSRGETTHRWATFLPDGRHFLYMAGTHAGGTKSEANAVYAGSLDSKDRTLVLQARSNVTYASGNLLYLRERVLLAQPFDARRLRLTGDPVPVAENVVYDPSFFRGALSASENGVLVYASGGSGRLTHLVWYDRAGKRVGDPIGDPAAYDSVAISPDGQRFAATMRDTGAGNADIWLGDFARGSLTRFTFGPFPVGSAIWSPDGSRIAFSRLERGAQTGIFIKPVSGSGQEDALLHADATAVPISWSRDGRFISYTQFQTGSKTKTDVWILPLTGDRKPFPFLATAFNEFGGWFSPDGHWILYRSDESGKNELYAAAFPGPGGKWEISKGGALDGSWNPSGGEIIYTTPELNVVSVPVRVAETGLDPGIPKTLFKGEPTVTSDMSPDGQRFLEAVHPEGARAPP